VASRFSDETPRLNLLCAFPYMTTALIKLIASNLHSIRFLLDSGAFTAWRAGSSIKLDDYCRFLETIPFKPWRYFALDVVGKPDATRRNYETMLKRGFTPVPVFTRGEDIKEIERYYKTSEVIAVGGLVGTAGNRGFINGIMKKIGKRRVHWLGFTSLPFLKAYRPYMCDTSSWESGARYATWRLYAGRGRLIQVSKAMFQKSAPKREILDTLATYGVDPYALRIDKNWSGGYSMSRALNAHSGVRLMLDLQEHLRTLYFSGATTIHAIQLLLRGWEAEKVRRGIQ